MIHSNILFCNKYYIIFYNIEFGCKQDQMSQQHYLEKDYMFFCPKIIFPCKWNFKQFFLQTFVINVYNYPNIHDMFFCLNFLNEYENMKMCWFLVNSMFYFLKW